MDFREDTREEKRERLRQEELRIKGKPHGYVW